MALPTDGKLVSRGRVVGIHKPEGCDVAFPPRLQRLEK